MPHRISTFFRAHSNTFDLPTDLKKASRRSSSSRTSRPSVSDRSPSSSGSSLISDDKSAKMPDIKRISLPGLHSPKSSSSKIPQQATFDVVIESPPLVLYGSATASTGALLSGQLKINVLEDVLIINSFKMNLALEVTRKKPFHNHCTDCQNQSSDLNSWNFLHPQATLRKGEHTFPFSFLLPGHLPASMKGSLSSIKYLLHATVDPKTGDPLKLSQVLDVKRAIFPAEHCRNSIRIFPPTNLTANCQLPAVIHPIGENKISMRMDGVIKRNPDTKTQTHWKLKRLTWRLDEMQKMISPACAKHVAKLGPNVEENKKGIAHQDVRTIGTDELKTGWKTDYTSPDGTIEVEFPFSVRTDAKAICDLKAEDGTEISHVLIVEMIVAEEFAPIKKPNQVTPTGAARVLRMHFNIILTERSGMGISWDEEQPPLYENVPASPPAYAVGDAHVYEGEPIPDYEDLPPLDDVADALPSISSGSDGPSSRRFSNSDLVQDARVASSFAHSAEVEDSADVTDTGVLEERRGA